MSDILKLREERVKFQEQLISEYRSTLVTIRPNYPGCKKDNPLSTYAVYSVYKELLKTFAQDVFHATFSDEGVIFYLPVPMTAEAVKLKCIEIEEMHPLGRLTDIDVYDQNSMGLTRSELGFKSRKCFICEEDAIICTRSGAHPLSQIKSYFEELVISYICTADDEVLRVAQFALLNELMRKTSLGCVTITGSGTHSDMDFKLFLRSIEAVSRGLLGIDKINYCSFEQLRSLGLRLEGMMFQSTGGVNTHKGAIFSFLTLIAAFLKSHEFSEMPKLIAEVSKPSLADFDTDTVSYGLDIYRKYRIKGIRGEAAMGYPNLFNDYLPFWEKSGMDPDRSLLNIASSLEDTNVIHRSGYEKYLEYKSLVTDCKHGKRSLETLEAFCMNHRISAGGSADMLSLTILTWMIKHHYYRLKEVFEIDNFKGGQ